MVKRSSRFAVLGIVGMDLSRKGRAAMVRRLASPLLMLALGLLVATSVAADATTVQGPNNNYSLTVPDGWQANPPDALGLTLTNTANGATFMISSSPANGMALGDIMQQNVTLASQLPGYEADPKGVQDGIIGGQTAKLFTFHSNDLVSGKPLSSALVIVINQDTAYSLYFETARENENATDADITTMVTSWQFT
jgi:hypothetical protein